jgi:hypothetical protein
LYTAYGWFDLSITPDDDLDELDQRVAALRAELEGHKWLGQFVSLHLVASGHVLGITAGANHGGAMAPEIEALIQRVAAEFPESHGLLFEMDDDLDPPADNEYRLRVMVRGAITDRPDPFFSPLMPTVDAFRISEDE